MISSRISNFSLWRYEHKQIKKDNYASKNVRVNAVAPGWIATKMTDTLRSSKFPEREKEILSRTPMKRWGEPEDIAGPIYFLSSEELSGFVTGVILPVDGGYLIYP